MEPDRVRAQLDRMLRSGSFKDAERARNILCFVVERALAGRGGEIKESVIATEVLGRRSSFDPRIDPIVRVEAGRLRMRLTAYYLSEGSADRLEISLPKGGYAPTFAERMPPKDLKLRPRIIAHLLTAAAGLILGCGALLYFRPASQMTENFSLSLLPPPGVLVEASAISPDARYVAFAGLSHDATQRISRLWVRSLSSTEARPLAGTEGAAYPFWSPDSSSIGFFSPGKLKAIQLSGGPPRTICNVDVPLGGAWSTSGVILFAPRPGGILFQAPVAGGAPRPASRMRADRGELSHEFPVFLSDGRHFVFSVRVRRPGESVLRIGSLDSMESKVLLNADTGVAYSQAYGRHSASLIFSYKGALVSQPFNVERQETAGPMSALAPEVIRNMGRTEVSVSRNGVLAFRAGPAKNRQLTWFDRDGRVLSTVGRQNSFLSWNLSPEETRLAIQEEDPADGSWLWMLDLERGSLSHIATTGAQAFFPIWSPDGSEVLFSDGTHDSMPLVRQSLDGTKGPPASDAPDVKWPTDWSVDGKFVVYFAPNRPFGALSLWVLPMSMRSPQPPRMFSSGSAVEYGAVFSPILSAGAPRWIAYASNESGPAEVYVKNFPAGNRKWQVSNQGGWAPHWRRDGRELFYLALDGRLMSVELNAGPGFQASSPRPLFQTSIPAPPGYPAVPPNPYAVSRDGSRFLINQPIGDAPQSITITFPSSR